jgi:hypothetical protein
MRIALPLVALSLILIAGCTTEPKATAAGPSPAKDTYFVPPPKSLTARATPEAATKDVAKNAAKPAAAQ